METGTPRNGEKAARAVNRMTTCPMRAVAEPKKFAGDTQRGQRCDRAPKYLRRIAVRFVTGPTRWLYHL
jgi:hypothetical protein